MIKEDARVAKERAATRIRRPLDDPTRLPHRKERAFVIPIVHDDTLLEWLRSAHDPRDR